MLVHTAHFLNGAILSGTSAPVILTSRSDSVATKVNSIALASVLADHLKKKNAKNCYRRCWSSWFNRG